mgnify:CR=1 FL=1
MDKITIIVPCYNEAEVVPHFYDAVETATAAIPDAAFTYLFIDDGSRDATLTAIRALAEAHTNVRYISFTRNFEEYCPTPRNPCTMIPLLCKRRAVREIIVSISVSSVDLPTRTAGWIPARGYGLSAWSMSQVYSKK